MIALGAKFVTATNLPGCKWTGAKQFVPTVADEHLFLHPFNRTNRVLLIVV